MSDMSANIKAKSSIQVALTAATVNGVAVDTAGFEEAMVVAVSVVTGAGTTTAFKLQEGLLANGSDAADVPQGTLPTSTGAGTYTKTMSINLAKRKRYLRLVHIGAGGSAGGTISGLILLGNPMYAPVAQEVAPQILRQVLKGAIENQPPPSSAPGLESLEPVSATIGVVTADFEVYCNGFGFAPESVIVWNGGDEATDFVSANQVHTTVTVATMVNPASIPIQVRNADGQTSGTLYFDILPPV